MLHYLNWLQTNNIKFPDIIVHLRPTYPTRKVKTIDDCIQRFIDNYKHFDSLRTVIISPKTPFKMYTINNDQLIPLFDKIENIIEPYNRCRQELPDTYLHNGYIDIIKPQTIMKQISMSGDKILPYIMDSAEYHDIDTIEDWNKAEIIVLQK